MWIKHDFTPVQCHIMHSAILKLFKMPIQSETQVLCIDYY